MKNVGEIVDLASAYYGSAVLFAAIDCSVFAAVEETDGSFAALVKKTGMSERGLRLLLDACAAEGLLEKVEMTGGGGDQEAVYRNTPAGAMALVPGGKADLTKAIRYNRDVYPVWGRLAEFVKSGAPAERPEIHLGEDAARTKAFAASMFGRAMGIGRGVVPMLNLSGSSVADSKSQIADCEAGGRDMQIPDQASVESNNRTIGQSKNLRILDLAGGPGAYAILVCQANPTATCVTVDLPAIAAAAKGYVAQFGLADRIECRAGDYHSDEYEPHAYDVVTIFGALHQESPADIVSILKRAARALKPGGRVLVLDMMTDATHTAPKFSALFAVNMALTTTNGWVFSDEELKGWMREAGLTPGETRPVPPPMPHWLVEGRLVVI